MIEQIYDEFTFFFIVNLRTSGATDKVSSESKNKSLWPTLNLNNCIGGVMVSMFASSVVGHDQNQIPWN